MMIGSQVIASFLLVFIVVSMIGIAYSFFSGFLAKHTNQIDRSCVTPRVRIVAVYYPTIILSSDGVSHAHIIVSSGSKQCRIDEEINRDDVVDLSKSCMIKNPDKIIVFSDECSVPDSFVG